jgi:hypothetical protein
MLLITQILVFKEALYVIFLPHLDVLILMLLKEELDGGAGSEDCLNVNIYAPFGAKKGDNCEY